MGGLLSVLVRALDCAGAANKEAGMAGLVSLQALEGRWRLSRVIRNADGSEAQLSGVTVFRRDGEGLVQEEEGWLTLPGGAAPLRAARRYRWAEAENGLEVRFEDGRPFHAVPLGIARPEAEHDCAPDVYRVAYDFADWPHWRAVWSVTGPRKDYVMTSDYAPD
jgi:hypothetical protein